jgi:aspartyl-tRNA synthetase
MLRTHTCGEITKKDLGKEVTICGWVSSRRDHGNLIFMDIRDRYGITQIVFNPEHEPALHKDAQLLRDEFVVQAKGIVSQRPEGTVNKKILTGDIEVVVSGLEVLNISQTPLFPIEDDADISEDIRYAYRYLDLRRPCMQKNLILRSKACAIMRRYFTDKNFIEIETPVLTKSTPEGARDYLVPSRVQAGKFFALPQSPQLFKQILMVAGIDRYFQIAKCFRDEDLRADRQPEFTQLDIEASFIQEADIFCLIEQLIRSIFSEIMGITLATPFPVLSYRQAIDRYGCDKPDTRFGMELIELTECFKGSGFKVFSEAIASGGIVKAIVLKNPAEMPRSRIDELTVFAKGLGLKGLAYVKVDEKTITGPIAKFLSDAEKTLLIEKTMAVSGDYIFFAASNACLCNEALSRIRLKLGQEQGLLNNKSFNFLWVDEFPLFKFNNEENRYESEHHPFTAPHSDDICHILKDPLKVRSRSYDLVLNGVELGSGSIRIHSKDVQEKVFQAIGIESGQAEERFGFLTKALSFGAPPHGGFALGLDRLTAMLCGSDSIRDVIAFPKTQRAICPLTQAPSNIPAKQLGELGLKVIEE